MILSLFNSHNSCTNVVLVKGKIKVCSLLGCDSRYCPTDTTAGRCHLYDANVGLQDLQSKIYPATNLHAGWGTSRTCKDDCKFSSIAQLLIFHSLGCEPYQNQYIVDGENSIIEEAPPQTRITDAQASPHNPLNPFKTLTKYLIKMAKSWCENTLCKDIYKSNCADYYFNENRKLYEIHNTLELGAKSLISVVRL